MDQYTFESLHNIFIWWEEAENNFKTNQSPPTPRNHRQDVVKKEPSNLIPDSRNKLMEMYNTLFRILLSRKLPLSSHEIDDFDQVGQVKN